MHSTSLIVWQGKHITKPTPGINRSLASLLRLSSGHSLSNIDVGFNLCSAHRRNVGTGTRERRIKATRSPGVVRGVQTGSIDTLARVPRYAVVPRAVQDRDAHQAELHVLVALALGVEGRQVVLVVAV